MEDNLLIDDEKEKARKQRIADNAAATNNALQSSVIPTVDTSSWGSTANLPRYQTYNSNLFGSFGYNTIQNLDKIYNEAASPFEDLSRGFVGMMQLADIGFSDTFGMGAFKDDNNASQFMDVMNQYSSSRGGVVGFIANTGISAGYTIGIMEAIAAEEFLMTLGTAATGGFGGAAQGARSASLFSKAGKNLGRFYEGIGDTMNVYKMMRSKGTAELAKTTRWSQDWFKARGIKATGDFGKVFRGALPFSNTADFARGLHNLENANSLTKGTLAAGAMYRDARKMYLAYSEAKLEGDMVYNEVLDEKKQAWYAANPGKIMSIEEMQNLEKDTLDAYNTAFVSNFGLIYITNSVFLDNMLAPLSKLQMRTNAVTKTSKGLEWSRVGGKVSITAQNTPLNNYLSSFNLWNRARTATLGQYLEKGTSFVVESSMEGLQEVGQDIISSASKKYAHTPIQERAFGSYLSQVYNSLGDWDAHSFWSGFFISSFAHPTNVVTQAFTDFTVGDKNYIWTETGRNREAAAYKRRSQDAAFLEKFYNETGTFAHEMASDFVGPLFHMQDVMYKAAQDGNLHKFHNFKSDISRVALEKTFKYGLEGEIIDMLEELSTYTLEELNAFTKRTDITEENKQELLQDAADLKNKIITYKKNYDAREKDMRLQNPISIQQLSAEAKQTDPSQWAEDLQTYTAWETLRSDYLYHKDAIEDFQQRIVNIKKKVIEKTKMTQSQIDVLIAPALLNTEIEILEEAVQANIDYAGVNETFLETEQHQDLVERLNALKEYKEVKNKLFEGQEKDALSSVQIEDLIEQMFEAFNTYMNSIQKVNDNPAHKEINREVFFDLFDIPILKKSEETFFEHAMSLHNPEYQNDYIEKIKADLQFIEDNKKEIIERSLKAFQESEASDALIKELLANDLIFHLDEIDDLIQKGIMPSKIYNASTNEEATKEEYDKAKEIISKAYDNLTGKKITIQSRPSMASKKFDGDNRTSAQLMASTANVNDIFSLINYLISSDQTTKVEKAILTELLDNVTFEDNIQVVVGDNLGQAVGINLDSDGKLVLNLDVRHASSDYTIDKGPGESKARTYRFESVAISGLINYYMQNKMKTDSVFANMVDSFYTAAKADMLEYLQQTQPSENWTAEKIDELAMFSSPTVFLSEALHNEQFRDLLDSIKDPSSSVDQSILEALEEEIDSVLSENLADPTLLARANTLALSSFMELSETDTEVKLEPVSAVKANSDFTIEELGITQEEWDGLTEEEKEDIKNCR